MEKWGEEDTKWLIENYSYLGRKACAHALGKTEDSIRMKTYRLGLKQNRDSEFFKEWQHRAAKSKIGKKRPEQSEVIKKLHKEGKLLKTEKQKQETSIRFKKYFEKNPHPAGMKGKKHSEKVKNLLSAKSKEIWEKYNEEEIALRNYKMMQTRIKNGTYAPNRKNCSWRAGWREIGGKKKYFRSKWEANYAHYLEWLKNKSQIKDWFHEPDVFWFDGIKRGCVSYLPDFKIIKNDSDIEYHEVKGWMDDKSKIKIKRMAKYHPNVLLVVIDKTVYKNISKKLCKIIPGWET